MKLPQLGQHFSAVGTENVPPNSRISCCDARKIPETRTGQLQKSLAFGLLQQAIYLGKGQQMRHMADRGKGLVVRLGCHLMHPTANGLPQRGGLGDLSRRVVGQGGEDEGAVLVQRAFSMVHACLGFARDRVSG